jgi:hypothetical protein
VEHDEVDPPPFGADHVRALDEGICHGSCPPGDGRSEASLHR